VENSLAFDAPADRMAARRCSADERWFFFWLAVSGSSYTHSRTWAWRSLMSSLRHTKVGGSSSGMGALTEDSEWPSWWHIEYSVLHVAQVAFLQTHGCTGFLILGQRRASWSVNAHPRH